MSEIAMVSARKSRLETAAKKGSKTAKTALRLANEPDRFLSTIQIGITLIGILTGLYSGEALAGDLARWLETIGIPQAHSLTLAKGIIVILVTYLTLILGELVPKHLDFTVFSTFLNDCFNFFFGHFIFGRSMKSGEPDNCLGTG